MDIRSRIRSCLVAEKCFIGLGALSRWRMGLARSVWMDLGIVRTLGMGAISLWQVGIRIESMVLGTGHVPTLFTGAGRLYWLWSERIDSLGAAGPARQIPSLVGTAQNRGHRRRLYQSEISQHRNLYHQRRIRYWKTLPSLYSFRPTS